jgi:hypothetical protein
LAEGDQPLVDIDVARIPSQDEIEQMLQERLEERISTDERVQRAALIDAQAQVDAEFNRLQDAYRIPLTPEVRDSLLREAVEKQTSDLEGLLARRLVAAQQRQSRTADIAQAATTRPGTPSLERGDSEPPPPKSLSESFQQAKMLASQQ